MRYRIGRWTTGISLVLFGFLVLLSQLTDLDGLALASNLWPLVLIGYGVEYLFHARKKEQLRFDVTGAIIITIAFVLIIGSNVFGGFGFFGPKYSYQAEPIYYSSEGVDTISASTKNGKVVVRASEGDQIQVLATYRIPAFSEKQALEKKEKIKLDVKANSGTLNVEVRYPNNSWFGGINESVDLTIYIPSNDAVEVRTSNGAIEITGIENVKYVKTSNGRISLVNSSGASTILNTSNGSIDIDGFVGALTAKTSNGRISIKNGEVTGMWSVKTSNGGIDVDVLKNGSYDYYFSTSNGSIHAPNPPFSNEGGSKKTVKGIVNGGQHQLFLETSNGTITVDVR